MKTKFRTKNNRLTAYSFGCGYIETKSDGQLETKMWHEGACYHVLQYDWKNRDRVFWESFETLTEARKFFDKQPGKRHK